MKLSVYLLFFVSLAVAGEPNYVRITICKVGKKSGADNDLVTTTYSDGLGRHIQAKVKIDDSHDRTVCVFYDNAGRRDTSTNAFIDDTRPGSYLEGTFGKINAPDSPLRTIYNDSRAFSYSRYAQEPQSRIVEQNGPGEQFEHNPAKLWRLGVTKEKITIPTDARDVEFDNGLVTTDMNGNDFDDELDYLSSNPAFVSPMFFLTVLKDARGNYSQELKDLFGNSLATCAMDSGNMIVAKYSYNVHGNLLTEAAPKPTDTIADASYTYNALGQLINKATPDGGSFAYAYTLSGQLASDTSYGPGNAVYRIRRYTYDNMGRLVLTELKNDNDPAHDNWTAVIHNYYDDVDLLNSDAARYNIQPTLLSSLANLKGRLVAGIAVNKVNGLTYYICDLFSYDDEGRIGKKVKIVPGLPCQTVSYSYDLQDKVLSDTTVCGSQNIIMAYQYDGEGRLEHVIHVSNSDKTVASYSYDDLGRPNIKTLAIGSGEQMEYRYNVRGWVNYIGAVSGNHLTNKFSEVITLTKTTGTFLTRCTVMIIIIPVLPATMKSI